VATHQSVTTRLTRLKTQLGLLMAPHPCSPLVDASLLAPPASESTLQPMRCPPPSRRRWSATSGPSDHHRKGRKPPVLTEEPGGPFRCSGSPEGCHYPSAARPHRFQQVLREGPGLLVVVLRCICHIASPLVVACIGCPLPEAPEGALALKTRSSKDWQTDEYSCYDTPDSDIRDPWHTRNNDEGSVAQKAYSWRSLRSGERPSEEVEVTESPLVLPLHVPFNSAPPWRSAHSGWRSPRTEVMD
jgi:hypothetical protein